MTRLLPSRENLCRDDADSPLPTTMSTTTQHDIIDRAVIQKYRVLYVGAGVLTF